MDTLFAICRSSEDAIPPLKERTFPFATTDYFKFFITPSTSLHHHFAPRLLYLSNCMHLRTSATLFQIRATIATIPVSVENTTRSGSKPSCVSPPSLSST